ncbi:MAG: FG-GAP repeat protein, partial [Acidobacteriota bacterium]
MPHRLDPRASDSRYSHKPIDDFSANSFQHRRRHIMLCPAMRIGRQRMARLTLYGRITALLALLISAPSSGLTETKLTADDAEAFDQFGYAVSVHGSTALVGARFDTHAGVRSGSAYIFQRNAGGTGGWQQIAKLIADDAADLDWFGVSVSVDGDTAIVGAFLDDGAGNSSGSAYVFHRNAGGTDNWGQVKKLTADDAVADDRFGVSVGVHGEIIVVGTNGDDDDGSESGSAYVFRRNAGGTANWGQVKKLTADDAIANGAFGGSVSVHGNTVIVGAAGDNHAGNLSGSAYIFSRNAGGADNWGQVKKLTADDASENDQFGTVSVHGDTAIVSARFDSDAGTQSGSAYIFSRNAGG